MKHSQGSHGHSVPPSRLVMRYLTVYNFVSCLLWLCVLGRVLLLIPLVGTARIYGGVGEFAKWTQTLALLEIGHSLAGLVHSPVSTTAMQVSSRILLTWGIVNQYPDATSTSPFYSSMLLAWSMAEVIRYSYFAVNLGWGHVPGFLIWLRYNAFFVLYPAGIGSEVREMLLALPEAWQDSPTFALVLIGILAAYIPGTYILYTHMMHQRRKILRGKTPIPPKQSTGFA